MYRYLLLAIPGCLALPVRAQQVEEMLRSKPVVFSGNLVVTNLPQNGMPAGTRVQVSLKMQ